VIFDDSAGCLIAAGCQNYSKAESRGSIYAHVIPISESQQDLLQKAPGSSVVFPDSRTGIWGILAAGNSWRGTHPTSHTRSWWPDHSVMTSKRSQMPHRRIRWTLWTVTAQKGVQKKLPSLTFIGCQRCRLLGEFYKCYRSRKLRQPSIEHLLNRRKLGIKLKFQLAVVL